MPLKALEKSYRFLREEDAATAVEYAIMVVLIAAVVIATVAVLGHETANAFNKFVAFFGGG